MATAAQILQALLDSDQAQLNTTLVNMRELLNAIHSIDIERIERVGAAAAETIKILKEFADATPPAA